MEHTDLSSKVETFEYLTLKLIDWYKEEKGIDSNDYGEFNKSNDFSILKVIKLHYLVVLANASNNSLLTIFNKFYAMPYGHVESDIYNNINELKRLSISRFKTVIKEDYLDNPYSDFNLDKKLILEIIEAIKMLKEKSPNIITSSPTVLVEFSHSLRSWKSIYNMARAEGKYSGFIPSAMIENESYSF